MDAKTTINRPSLQKLLHRAVMLIGAYAVIHHAGEWAYTFGRFVGAN